ncbi:hypothetical protein CAPTEDRAFT_165421 [Capitella teleta]|uniref:Uncharacterized protein n=1 Tax=Capitella teleta TaxID=283909 RepID=R7U7Q1_CAPTE|nr:hypothetical protein CAPTEDRAFT_165421 [Capitella teleta]|eukprot:ELT99701.1 hypothetical protein CAPTEDRAFT_165421 [Capitella teleta]
MRLLILLPLLSHLLTQCFALSDYFWFISDIHFDPTYGSASESCREDADLMKLGEFGSVDCDAPWRLAESAIHGMHLNGGGAQFIVWAGDSVPHTREDTLSEEKVLTGIQKLTDQLRLEFPRTPVYPLLGNHDYHPRNQLPGKTNNIYESLATMWQDWLNEGGRNPEVLETFRKGGYYTKIMVELDEKIRALVLNTNLYYLANEATDGIDDPGEQFAWMEEVLQGATQEDEKVHVFVHIPPGTDFRSQQNSRFNRLIVKYADVILGIYAGHHHFDSFRIYYDEQNAEPVAGMFISPSVSPLKGYLDDSIPHNPAIRKYIFDRYKFTLQDYEQFYLLLDLANSQNNTAWQILYSFSKTYGVKNVDPANLVIVKDGFKEFANEDFHKYYERKYVNLRRGYVPCDCDCKEQEICAIGNLNRTQYDACVVEADCSGLNGAGTLNAASLGAVLVAAVFIFH